MDNLSECYRRKVDDKDIKEHDSPIEIYKSEEDSEATYNIPYTPYIDGFTFNMQPYSQETQ